MVPLPVPAARRAPDHDTSTEVMFPPAVWFQSAVPFVPRRAWIRPSTEPTITVAPSPEMATARTSEPRLVFQRGLFEDALKRYTWPDRVASTMPPSSEVGAVARENEVIRWGRDAFQAGPVTPGFVVFAGVRTNRSWSVTTTATDPFHVRRRPVSVPGTETVQSTDPLTALNWRMVTFPVPLPPLFPVPCSIPARRYRPSPEMERPVMFGCGPELHRGVTSCAPPRPVR